LRRGDYPHSTDHGIECDEILDLRFIAYKSLTVSLRGSDNKILAQLLPSRNFVSTTASGLRTSSHTMPMFVVILLFIFWHLLKNKEPRSRSCSGTIYWALPCYMQVILHEVERILIRRLRSTIL
jgi:hypothetical protein